MNLFYFVFPFFGLVQGMKNFLKRNSVLPIVIFGFWFGYTVFYYSGDVLHYRDNFKFLIDYTWNDFFTIVWNNYSREGVGIFNKDNLFHSKPDLFAITLGFLISRITEEPRLFFAVLGVIYFFLVSHFLKEAVVYTNSSYNKNWKLFFIFLVFIVPFYVGITGVRFWTALFLFGWMVLRFINTGKTKFVFFAAFSCLMHYTFIFPVAVVSLTFFLKLNKSIAKPVVILGVIYALLSSTTSSLDFISDIVKLADNEVIEESASSYLNQDRLSERHADVAATNWYVQWRIHLINIFFLSFYLIDFFYLRNKNPVKSKFFERNYDIFFLISLFTLNLGSIARFIYIFYFFVLIRLMEIHSSDCVKKYSIWSKIALPILFLHILVTFRSGFYFVDPYLVFMPSILLVFFESDVSLSQLLIGH